ncbi:hypothetical protein EBB07_25070 [Paenibacillaceae bacterium]|nr:hypothetical protein EBB07_25070 [Paenibacillaceae bacterium]
MASVCLAPLAGLMRRESKSFVDSLYAVLTAAGLFNGTKYWLSGTSGLAFKFTVHERLLPMSVSAYGQFGTEHQAALDNLGIWTASDGGRTRHPTFHYYQQDAVRSVKESLDQGIGVIYWIPEFGVIYGYDDDDGIFLVQSGKSPDSDIVLYDNFGLNFTPFWSCHWIGGKVEVEPADMVLESLRVAVEEWETPHKTLPDRAIASGRLGYQYLMRALESGDYDEGGADYILKSYMYAKDEISRYIQDAVNLWPPLAEAARLCLELAQLVPVIQQAMNDGQPVNGKARWRNHDIVSALQKALALEELAIREFKRFTASFPDPKRTIVPRWGIHSPR